MFGNNKVIKKIEVQGMSCMHCSKKVENALKELKQVKTAKVDLESKTAEVILKDNVDNDILKSCIEDLGYEVKKIS